MEVAVAKTGLWMGCSLWLIGGAIGHAQDNVKIERQPIHGGVNYEYGVIREGYDELRNTKYNSITINKTAAWFVQEATVNDRLHLAFGFGGLFFYRFPEQSGNPDFNVKYWAGGLSQAYGTYSWGDLDGSPVRLTGGLFSYKYNPDSRNLGEYLFRSYAYPNTIFTGVWDYANNSKASLFGLNLSVPLLDGKFRNNLILNREENVFPLHDWSLSYLAGFRPENGLVDIGAGVMFERLISQRPSRTTPERDINGYVETANGTFLIGDPANTLPGDTSYYTFKSIKAIARASINPQVLFPNSILGPEDLKLYGEVAVLGVKDYPILYDKLANRIPLMLGFNLPTFGLLDVFSVEVERWTNPNLNSTAIVRRAEVPKPYSTSPLDSAYTKDDFKWSIFAKKSVFNTLSVILQVANDHLRPIASDFNPAWTEVSTEPSHWYWLFRFELGI